MKIIAMSIDDYDEVISLWRDAEGMGLHDDCDSPGWHWELFAA